MSRPPTTWHRHILHVETSPECGQCPRVVAVQAAVPEQVGAQGECLHQGAHIGRGPAAARPRVGGLARVQRSSMRICHFACRLTSIKLYLL